MSPDATPASRIRGSVLDVLESEGFIRGYASVEHGSGNGWLKQAVVDGATLANSHYQTYIDAGLCVVTIDDGPCSPQFDVSLNRLCF